jgi:hypothetical protein
MGKILSIIKIMRRTCGRMQQHSRNDQGISNDARRENRNR